MMLSLLHMLVCDVCVRVSLDAIVCFVCVRVYSCVCICVCVCLELCSPDGHLPDTVSE